jgi:hypothetical protein
MCAIFQRFDLIHHAVYFGKGITLLQTMVHLFMKQIIPEITDHEIEVGCPKFIAFRNNLLIAAV